MIRRQNELGEIAVSNNVYTYIAGSAATNCFGVKGMAIRSMKDGLVHLLRRESLAKGVLIVDQGVNIPALGSSILNEVRYVVSQQTETEIREVNILVDSMMTD